MVAARVAVVDPVAVMGGEDPVAAVVVDRAAAGAEEAPVVEVQAAQMAAGVVAVAGIAGDMAMVGVVRIPIMVIPDMVTAIPVIMPILMGDGAGVVGAAGGSTRVLSRWCLSGASPRQV
ncbi:hypothetical protein ATCC53582_01413 [Novacetimonas hansenii]|nr:hypothetical protein ATCC53582_01413 [Novacetimonas hansenii]